MIKPAKQFIEKMTKDMNKLLAEMPDDETNRCLWYDVSLVPAELKTPDFKIPTEVYSVENHAKWSAKDEWFYGFEEIKT